MKSDKILPKMVKKVAKALQQSHLFSKIDKEERRYEMVPFEEKEKYDINDLLQIVKRLRDKENGCPWDVAQTHESIRKNFIEETYEAVEAIDLNDKLLLQEELGDVLLQVVLHAQMEQEASIFDFSDVCDTVSKKLINRHPHIFGSVMAETTEEVLQNWDTIKEKEKKQKSGTDTVLAVPNVLPALMRAEKVQKRAGKAGMDFENTAQVFDAVKSEICELEDAFVQGNVSNVQEELGDLLFSVVNLARFLKVDAEEELTFSTNKFITRFIKAEELARAKGLSLQNASFEEKEMFWQEAKMLTTED